MARDAVYIQSQKVEQQERLQRNLAFIKKRQEKATIKRIQSGVGTLSSKHSVLEPVTSIIKSEFRKPSPLKQSSNSLQASPRTLSKSLSKSIDTSFRRLPTPQIPPEPPQPTFMRISSVGKEMDKVMALMNLSPADLAKGFSEGGEDISADLRCTLALTKMPLGSRCRSGRRNWRHLELVWTS